MIGPGAHARPAEENLTFLGYTGCSVSEGQHPNAAAALFAQLTSSKTGIVKFGGVNGKLAFVAIAAIFSFPATLLAAGTEWFLKAGCGIALLVFSYAVVRLMRDYASDHPESATLEGAEMLVLKQQLLGAKGMPTIPQADSVRMALGSLASLDGQQAMTETGALAPPTKSLEAAPAPVTSDQPISSSSDEQSSTGVTE